MRLIPQRENDWEFLTNIFRPIFEGRSTAFDDPPQIQKMLPAPGANGNEISGIVPIIPML